MNINKQKVKNISVQSYNNNKKHTKTLQQQL